MPTIVTQYFDVGNSAKRGAYILAVDAADALEVALAIGHIKSKKAGRVHGPMNMSGDCGFKSLEKLMLAGVRARVCKQVGMTSFMDIIHGKKGKSQWLIMRSA